MKFLKHFFVVILILIIISILFLGCYNKGDIENQDNNEISNENKKPDSSFIPLNQEHYVGIYAMGSYEYFTDHKIGLKKAGDVLKVKTEYIGPADNDIDEMIKCFNYAIENKVDGIIVFGANDRLKETINLAAEKGIPTVTVDGDIEDSKRIAFVGTGNYNAGQLGGNTLGEMLTGTGKVAILTEPDVALHRERTRGYVESLSKFENIEVVCTADTRANPDDAYESAKKILADYDDLNAIACTDYFGGIAAAIAVEEENKAGKVKILSMDRNRYVLEKIEEGIITATLVQQTALMPFYAMQILYNYNHKFVPIVSDPKVAGISGAPVFIDTGVFIIDENNYRYFVR